MKLNLSIELSSVESSFILEHLIPPTEQELKEAEKRASERQSLFSTLGNLTNAVISDLAKSKSGPEENKAEKPENESGEETKSPDQSDSEQ